MRNDITRVALVATEPEITQNEVFRGPSGGVEILDITVRLTVRLTSPELGL